MTATFARALQRAGPIAGMASLLAEFGVAPAEVAQGTHIDLIGLTPDSLIPFRDVLRLLARAAAETECPHFGLLLGSRYDVDSHGVISRLAAEAPTLRQALLAFVSLQPGYSSGATVYLSRSGQDVLFGYGIYDRTSPGSVQLYDCVLAFGCSFVRALTNGRVAPIEVLFCHREPGDLTPYKRILKAPLRFNQAQAGIIASGDLIDQPLPSSPGKRKVGLTETDLPLGIRDIPVTTRLRHIIRPQLLSGDASMMGAAAALGQIPRTLRRHLADEGLTFKVVRDEVRFVLACEMLALTDLPIGEISASLVFANQTAFVRAFRRWSGSTPSQWRKTAGAVTV
jgi:AraC-like DNA-binding protein